MEITFRGMDKQEATEELIRQKAAKLEQVCPHMISCRVKVEQDQKEQRVGNPYRVVLEVSFPPGHEVVVKRESTGGDIHNDLHKILRDAFQAARRSIKKTVEQQKGKKKSHPTQQTGGFVERLFPEEDYGFIKSMEGQDIYFHRNSVANDDFDRLSVGTGVTYVAELGDEGLQATTVRITDKPGERERHSPDFESQTVPEGWQQ
jgi:cold shock CspA family protein